MPILIDDPTQVGDSLDLCAVWLNAAYDPADCIAFTKAGDALSLTTSAQAGVRQLLGRRRMVATGSVDQWGRPARAETWSASLQHLDRTQVAWLRDHVGVLLCVRDHVGTKFFGVYTELPREVQTWQRDWHDVRLVIEQVDHTEAVT